MKSVPVSKLCSSVPVRPSSPSWLSSKNTPMTAKAVRNGTKERGLPLEVRLYKEILKHMEQQAQPFPACGDTVRAFKQADIGYNLSSLTNSTKPPEEAGKPWVLAARFCTRQARMQDQPRLPNLTGGISWTKRGGLQRLAWLAVARACATGPGAAESDLHGDLVRFAFASAWDAADAGKVWLKEGRWNEICQLAFRYLDVDGDGVLSTKEYEWEMAECWERPGDTDLCKHVKEDNASHVAANWVNLWGDKGGLSAPQRLALTVGKTG
eukprot:Skav224864  [mRNA]  locus=scaffold322:393391:398111:+ [translate_table: standard]